MKNIIIAIASVVVLLALGPAAAQQGKPAENARPFAPTEPDAAAFDKQLERMQENMNKMQEQMNRIRQTADPQERQRLLQEHWATMQNAMALMHGIGGAGMMGGPGMGPGMMGWRRMRNYYGKLTPDRLRQRQYMTDQQLRLHQQMMDQMMQRQFWMGQPQSAPRPPQ